MGRAKCYSLFQSRCVLLETGEVRDGTSGREAGRRVETGLWVVLPRFDFLVSNLHELAITRRPYHSFSHDVFIGSKAHHRVGTANFFLQRYGDAVKAFKRALELDPANKQCAEDLERAQAKAKVVVSEENYKVGKLADHPGVKVKAMIADFEAGRLAENPCPPFSAAARVLSAFMDFQSALELARAFPAYKGPKPMAAFGAPGTVQSLASCFISDIRVFGLENEDLEKIQTAILFEQRLFQAIGPEMSVPDVIQQYKQELATKGWDQVRGAFAVSTRAAIIFGGIRLFLRQNGEAVADLRRAIALIKLGRLELDPNNKDYSIRGSCFRETFLRGVQVMLMNTIMVGFFSTNDRAAFSMDEVKRLADEIIASCEAPNAPEHFVHQGKLDASLFTIFHVAPQAAAYMALGAYHGHLATRKSHVGKDGVYANTDLDEFERSGECYLKAATFMPQDEKEKPLALYKGTEQLMKAGVLTLGRAWDLKKQGDQSLEKAVPIWGPLDYEAMTIVNTALKQLGPEPTTRAARNRKLPPATFFAVDLHNGQLSLAPADKVAEQDDEEDELGDPDVEDEEAETALMEQMLKDLKVPIEDLVQNAKKGDITARPPESMVAPPS